MGLDVYLYRCDDRTAKDAAEDAYEQFQNAQWGERKYDDIPESERKEIRAKCATQAAVLGCNEWGAHKSATKIEQDSKLYPEHYFKIGYFRSSYNDGGINSVMRKLGLLDLYGIFEPKDRYEFTPDWDEALKRTNAAIETYTAHLDSIVGNLRVFAIAANPFVEPSNLPASEESVLELVREELKRKSKDSGGFTSYGNGKGDWFLDGLEIIAAIPGRRQFIGVQEPCVYLVQRQKRESGEKDWYLQALEIVRETIEYVLAQPDKQNFYFHWSS